MDSSPPPHNGKEAPPRKSISSGDLSSTNWDSSQQQPPPHPPPVAPPHMIYHNCPPGMDYSGGHYHNNSYPPPPHGYAPYPNQPPHDGYYPPQYYGAPPAYPTGSRGGGFCRGFIMCSCLIFSSFFIATVILALVLHPQLPIYTVTSLSVANFKTTPVLTGDWNISIVIENPNDRLRSHFSDFMVELVRLNDAVAGSIIPDFELDRHEKRVFDVRASSKAENGMSFQKLDLDLMAKQQESGPVTFELKVSSTTTFKSETASTRNALLVAICGGLRIVFQNNTGSLDNGGKPISCLLFM